MRFEPKELEGNVNVSKTHPLTELAWLLGGLVVIILIIYVLLGFAAQYASEHIPVEAEIWLGERAVMQYGADESEALRQRLDPLIEALPSDSPLRDYPFRIHLVESDEVNAVAMPGGQILVFSGLIKQAESENELMMVLAHELGHYANRDHLKGIGRGLGISLASILLFGQESGVSSLISDLCMRFESRYSQTQESAADLFALDLLVASQGHAGGAVDFFDRLSEKQNDKRFLYLFATHPHPANRTEELLSQITEKGYPVLAVQPLADDWQPENKDDKEVDAKTE